MTPLQHLHRTSSETLSASEVGTVLGLERRVVYDLVRDHLLECQAHRGRGGHPKRERSKPTYFFTRLAVLAYLVRCTRGDRAALLAEVELLFPKWLPFAQRVAAQADAAQMTNDEGGMPNGAALPKNVIRMRKHAPGFEHPDLFEARDAQSA